MTIVSDIQSLAPGSLIDFYTLDITRIGGGKVYFHNCRSTNGADLVWQGQHYQAFPIHTDGFERSCDKQSPRPTVRVANVTGLISNMLRDFEDLIGSTFTRKRTFVKYIDAVNFPGGINPQADPLQEFPDEIWIVDRKSAETKHMVEFELAAPWDLQGYKLPGRPCSATVCPWKYRSAECSYTGPAVAKMDDSYTSIMSEDVCGKRMTSCELRFGADNPLPAGMFVGVGIVR